MLVFRRFSMKKKLVSILLVVMLAGTMTACGGNDSGRTSDEVSTEATDNSDMVSSESEEAAGVAHLENAEAVSAFFDEMYAEIPQDQMPMGLGTMELDLSDAETVGYHTGLSDMSQIEGITLSESMVGSIAYSVIYVRTKDGADVEAIKQTMMDNIDPAKWICVTAEKQMAASFGEDIFYIMTAAETADLVYEQAVKAAEARDMKVSNVVEKVNPL